MKTFFLRHPCAEDRISPLTIIQVHGIGPFRNDFVEPVIFLSEPNNQPHFKYKPGQRVLSQKGPGVVAAGCACVKQRLV
jgi:hypothetical protein